MGNKLQGKTDQCGKQIRGGNGSEGKNQREKQIWWENRSDGKNRSEGKIEQGGK